MTVSFPTFSFSSGLEQEAELFRFNAFQQGLQPFVLNDTTAGMEYELQVAVEGKPEDVDLPIVIKRSGYFRNIVKRSERGDCSEQTVNDLRSFLADNRQEIWENSWVRLKTRSLSNYAARTIEYDFLADKTNPRGPLRSDRHRFFTVHHGEQWLRLPISYVLKLSLADCIGREQKAPGALLNQAEQLLANFISDNTSPEILSLNIVEAGARSIGAEAAREASRTFVFAQLLLQYANKQFELEKNGQRGLLYFSPQAPLRQKTINDLVPDSFYRQLFMSPCLSGWDRGEEKHAYMELCHRTLSRSQLNTITKLKEAGIIINNLVVLPNTSNTCLSNNGTHVSLGSHVLTSCSADPSTGFTPGVEKYFGDLAIKIIEHFLPLLVTTFSAAPFRIGYCDFHPEKVLGFLPHELDYTHLRMLWRRWRRKADIGVFGTPITPFGPALIDRAIALLTRAKGDHVPDFRLVDYLVALLSTETSQGLDGIQGNQESLKHDLTEMGVYDTHMAMYLPYRLRDYRNQGYSGFEGRFHSLFPSLTGDMGSAVDIQNLLTAMAYQYVISGKVTHQDIPDNPDIESERRQIFFATAIGLPTVYIRSRTKNRFLARILERVDNKRSSQRYKGYTRVAIKSYQLGLLRIIGEDWPVLVDQLSVSPHLETLKHYIDGEAESAAARLTRSTLMNLGEQRPALSVHAERFNSSCETYYRDTLRLTHLEEGIDTLIDDCRLAESRDSALLKTLARSCGLKELPSEYIEKLKPEILQGSLPADRARIMIVISLAIFHQLDESRLS